MTTARHQGKHPERSPLPRIGLLLFERATNETRFPRELHFKHLRGEWPEKHARKPRQTLPAGLDYEAEK